MEDIFKSPIKKLINFFKQSRDSWKERAKNSIQEIRVYKKRILFLESSKQLLKDKIKKLNDENIMLEKSLSDLKKKQ